MSLFNTATGRSAKFATIGDTITGTIRQTPFERQQTKFGSQSELDYWPNGDPKMAVVVPLQTTLREDQDDDGERTLWVTSSAMKKAIGQAIATARVADVAVGGVLTVQFIGFDPASKNAQNPKKLYTATYSPPATSLASAPPAVPPVPSAPTPQQPVAQAPVAAPGGLTPEQAQQLGQLRAAGIPEPTIATAIGATPQQIAVHDSTPF